MRLFINGKIEEIEDGMTISKLLALKNIRPEVVTVELNEQIINRVKYSEIILKENDKLEFVYYMGGGSTSLTAYRSKRGVYVYIIKCRNGSLYTGLTNNLERRLKEHIIGKGSLYTRYNPPIEVVYKECFYSFREAKRREMQIKRWTRRKKEALVKGDFELLKRL